MRRRLAQVLAGLLAAASVGGCTAAADSDGEALPGGRLAPALAKSASAVEVVVDTDLAPDDLVALAYLLRHPDVRVLAVTVPMTGLVTCAAGLDIAHDLMVAVEVEPVPISCGDTARGPHGRPFPPPWVVSATSDNGLRRDGGEFTSAAAEPPPRLLARLAREHPALQVVAIGPMTEVAAVLAQHPAAYREIDRIVAMTGVAEGPPQDAAAGEWNAAADPDALAAVLAGPVPVVVVPHEAVPPGHPDGAVAPVVGSIGVYVGAPPPAFWDLATAGWLTDESTGRTTSGTWSVALEGSEPGRLTRTGAGDDRVVTRLDAEALDRAYRAVFAPAE